MKNYLQKRRFIRLSSIFPVAFHVISKRNQTSSNFWIQGYTSNVSKGGLCIETVQLSDEDFIKSFEDSCKILEEDIENIQGTLSWVWCNSPNDVDRAVQKIYLKEEFNLVPKKDQKNK